LQGCVAVADTGPGRHRWLVSRCSVDLEADKDPVLSAIVRRARRSYGEYLFDEIPEPDTGVAARFDLRALRQAIRAGMPDPEAERGTGKPSHLRNYRSEAAELIAQEVLADAYRIQFPARPQVAKGNANQPVLGFDGWGLLDLDDGTVALVLVQVKASDHDRRPPDVAKALVEECARVPREPDKLCRALAAMLALLDATDFKPRLLAMLQSLGLGSLPALVMCPVIVRGTVDAHLDDFATLRAAESRFEPALARGLCISLGVALESFGHRVFSEARKP
jgi:hypothetical protein